MIQGSASTLRASWIGRAFTVAIVAVAAIPLIGEYPALVGTLAVVFGLVALGFVVLTGWAGQLSLGQVVPYGLGGYAAAWLGDQVGIPMALAIPLAAIVVIPASALIGLAAERLRGLDLAIGTFALALACQFLVFGSLGRALVDDTSGTASVVQVVRPSLFSLNLDSNRSFYLYALVLGALAYAAVAWLGRIATGRELLALGDDPTRAAVAGVPVGRLRLYAFIAAGMLASLAGGILAAAREAVTPETFTAFESLNLLAIAVVGGLSSVRGAVIAGAFGAVLPELARNDPFRFLQGRLTLVYGIALVAVLLARRGGLAAAIGLDKRPEPDLAGGEDLAPAAAPTERGSLLRIEALRVDYGGTRAVDDITLRVAPGEFVALVGPNGAGKSSVFDVASGLLLPAAGRVYFDGTDITDHSPEGRAALGLGRTFQAARVFQSLSVGENLLVAAHQSGRAVAHAVAGKLLDQLDLREVETELPGSLPFGSIRLLEVGLALAGRPRLLLLDEPAAGLDGTDLDRLAELLEDLGRGGVSVLLVDHDLAFVGRVAQRVVVMDQGRIIADDTPRKVTSNRGVQEAFLGTTARELAPVRKRSIRKKSKRPARRRRRKELTRASR